MAPFEMSQKDNATIFQPFIILEYIEPCKSTHLR